VPAPEAEMSDKVFHAMRNNDLRTPAMQPTRRTNHPAKRGDVEMVHVSMGYQDQVDGGKALHKQTWITLSAQHDKASSEDRINQNIAASDLEEEGRVADKGNAQFRGGYQFNRPGLTG
jgi:hypothetical protein